MTNEDRYLRDAQDYWFHVYTPKPGDVIVDVGAGRGEDVYAFSRAVGPTGRVLAVEPHPITFTSLQQLCEAHVLQNVVAVRCACVDVTSSLHIETLPTWESNYVRDISSTTSHPVDGVTLDDLLDHHHIDRVDFVKMNIEGAERRALPGCRKVLRRARYVCIAAHDFRADRGEGDSFRTLAFVKQALTDAGFTVITRDDPRYYVPYHVHGERR